MVDGPDERLCAWVPAWAERYPTDPDQQIAHLSGVDRLDRPAWEAVTEWRFGEGDGVYPTAAPLRYGPPLPNNTRQEGGPTSGGRMSEDSVADGRLTEEDRARAEALRKEQLGGLTEEEYYFKIQRERAKAEAQHKEQQQRAGATWLQHQSGTVQRRIQNHLSLLSRELERLGNHTSEVGLRHGQGGSFIGRRLDKQQGRMRDRIETLEEELRQTIAAADPSLPHPSADNQEMLHALCPW